MRVAIHGRNTSLEHAPRITAILDFLEGQGVEVCVYTPFLKFMEKSLGLVRSHPSYCHAGNVPDNTDFMVSIGGDGTFLDAARFVRERGIPLVGVNLGRLGFLAYVSGDEAIASLTKILQGSYVLEERSILQVSGSFVGPKHAPFALNEVSIQRKGPALIETTVAIDGEPLSSYWSDGLIIATPTGSTAYSMSVGGPIVSPDSANLILSPIAPHNLNIRPIVIPDSSVVTVKVQTRVDGAMLTVDNQMFEIESGTEFVVEKSTFAIKLVKLADSNFYRTLRNKLLWGLDPRS